jgi:hypothetical protein
MRLPLIPGKYIILQKGTCFGAHIEFFSERLFGYLFLTLKALLNSLSYAALPHNEV